VIGQKFREQFGQVRECARHVDVARRAVEVRAHNLARRDVHQFAPFFLKVGERDFREGLKRGAEPALHLSRSVRNATQLAPVFRQKYAYLVCFRERISSKYKRFSSVQRH
jgi:uncharacterized membrane protein